MYIKFVSQIHQLQHVLTHKMRRKGSSLEPTTRFKKKSDQKPKRQHMRSVWWQYLLLQLVYTLLDLSGLQNNNEIKFVQDLKLTQLILKI